MSRRTATAAAAQKAALAIARAHRAGRRPPTEQTAPHGPADGDLACLDRETSERCRKALTSAKVRVGDAVVLRREQAARRTWRRYDGRNGAVVALNRSEGEALIRVEGAGEA